MNTNDENTSARPTCHKPMLEAGNFFDIRAFQREIYLLNCQLRNLSVGSPEYVALREKIVAFPNLYLNKHG